MSGSDQKTGTPPSDDSGPWARAVPRRSANPAADTDTSSVSSAPPSHGKGKPGGPAGSQERPPLKRGRRPAPPSTEIRTSQTASSRDGDAIEQLASRLVRELEARVQRHPSGALVRERRESVPISLEVPIKRGRDRVGVFAKELDSALDAAVLSLVSERAVAESHAAFCLRCSATDCEHAKPGPKQVFVGYGPSGTPQFEDYSQALLNLGDDDMSELFGPSGRLVSRLWSEAELTHSLLPVFRETETGYRVLGQVTSGWYWLPNAWEDEAKAHGHARNFALTFQVALIDVAGQPRRLAFNVIGTSPTEGTLEDLHDAFGELPWAESQRWCRLALGDVERTLRRLPPSKRGNAPQPGQIADEGEVWHQRVLKILAGFERRLVRRERAKGRKTQHAETRRKQKRPTGHALADLVAASDDAVLRDTRKGTFVVLGDRGRSHIFNETGRLVTSIVYTPEAIEKRVAKGFWVRADSADVTGLRDKVEGGGVVGASHGGVGDGGEVAQSKDDGA